MRPYPEEVLRAIQSGIVAHFAPELTTKYGQAQFAFSMLLFAIVTRDYDTAVPDLVDGNRALRGLLNDASTALASIDAAGAASMTEHASTLVTARAAIAAIPEPQPSLRLSVLRAESEALRAVIAMLAPLIEPAADVAGLAPLAPVRARLYAQLSADARRRIFPILSA